MYRILALVAIALSAPTATMAGQNLEEAYRAGREFDPRFQVARFRYEAARESRPQAFAGLLPIVTLTANQGKEDQEILRRDNPFFGTGRSDFTVSAFSFQVSQPVFRFSSWVGLRQAKASVRQAYALFAAAEQDLILRTAEAYLTVLAAQDNLRFAEAEMTSVDGQLKVVKARLRAGLATVTDEFEAKARSARVTADVIAARYALDDAYEALREIVGDAITEVLQLEEKIPLVEPEPMNIDVWIARALEQNFELFARNEAVYIAEQEIRRQRASHFPSVDLVARHGNNETGGAVTGGGSDVDTTTVSLQLSVPIYSGGLVRSRTREAQKNYQRVLEERKLQHLVVMRETRAAFQGVRAAISRVEALNDSLLAQESLLEGRTTGYNSGVNTLLEVLDAESDLTSTRRDYARARYEYLLNRLRLKEQAGTLSEDDLLYVNEMLDRKAPGAGLTNP